MRLFNWLIGRCSHARTTFPQGKLPDIHITCLDCGKEFPYDWGRMAVQCSPPSRNDYGVELPDTQP